jgi:hypothetical protein
MKEYEYNIISHGKSIFHKIFKFKKHALLNVYSYFIVIVDYFNYICNILMNNTLK